MFSEPVSAPPQLASRLLSSQSVRLQGILFDIDGTLVDSNDIHARCWIEAFAHFGKQLDFEIVRHQIGKGGDLLVPDLLNAKEMRRFGEQLKKYRSEIYKKKFMRNVKPFPDVSNRLSDHRTSPHPTTPPPGKRLSCIRMRVGADANEDDRRHA